MGKGSYRNTKYKYVSRRLGQMFDSLCGFCDFHVFFFFVFYGILSKNDHAGPTYVAGVD